LARQSVAVRRGYARAEAHWHPQSGEFSYGEFEIVEAQFNVGAP
jgi:hypothetical protein